jgi:arginyl-tRNA synthetase
MFLEGFNTPLIVVKKDGGYNYDSTDLAAIKHRISTLDRNRVIVVTDLGQAQHF